jgi:hypothetical protein
MIAVISFICRPSVLLPAPNPKPGFNELSRSGPTFDEVIKALKMKDILRIWAMGDSKTGRVHLPVLKANDTLCLFFDQKSETADAAG